MLNSWFDQLQLVVRVLRFRFTGSDGDGALMEFQEVSSPDGSELDADVMLMAAEAGPTDVIDIQFDGHICNLKREAEVFGFLGVVEFRMYKISGRKARWKG
ncbi:Hypothetical predicted protein [Prunus dulcis]|uniref:Uncharacterized protein n=2 Tax=Prunus dulcis TaxID=3755 RepID=A0A5E4E273_PRUDU|nr:Hypothetical predicted protein [Prunus dulcis]